MLARASDQADNMVARARVEAKGRARQVEQETASLREDAEARMRSLQADIATISDERRTRLDDLRRIAARLEAVVAEAETAENETPPGKPATPAAVTTDAMPPAGPNGNDAQDQPPHATESGREN